MGLETSHGLVVHASSPPVPPPQFLFLRLLFVVTVWLRTGHVMSAGNSDYFCLFFMPSPVLLWLSVKLLWLSRVFNQVNFWLISFFHFTGGFCLGRCSAEG